MRKGREDGKEGGEELEGREERESEIGRKV